ncbi:MAG: riboflavin synthase [Armatimonadota bacterium]|jgi:riboflavin synthase
MFTGIVECIGTISAPEGGADGMLLTVDAGALVGEMRPGDSVAVNGACLTVERIDGARFVASVVPETLARTTLGRVGPGDAVNLERAMGAGGRFDGHFVQGHIDGVETIVQRTAGRDGVVVAVSLSPELAPFVASKGSIAVDGVSLTVVDVAEGRFGFTLVPYTLANTTLGNKAVREPVNIEVDVLAKYVARMLGHTGSEGRRLDESFLAEHGFAG